MKLLYRKGYLTEEQSMTYLAETDADLALSPLQSIVIQFCRDPYFSSFNPSMFTATCLNEVGTTDDSCIESEDTVVIKRPTENQSV